MSSQRNRNQRSSEDLYEGFDDGLNIPPTSLRVSTAFGQRSAPLTSLTSSSSSNNETGARPLTSVAGAGYNSKSSGAGVLMGRAGMLTDPSGRALGPAPPLLARSEGSPDEQAREMVRRVHALIESSVDAAARGDAVLSLERAKEAARKERSLSKFRETAKFADSSYSNGSDLAYAVCFNLGSAYHMNHMLQEALNTFGLLVKNKAHAHANQLRVNMGNIHFEMREYAQAIKMYRMALDQISPSSSSSLRTRILRNIGITFVKVGKYQEAITSFEAVMDSGAADFQTAFNLITCYFALGDAERMKAGFKRMLQIPLPISEDDVEDDDLGDDDEENIEGNDEKTSSGGARSMHQSSSHSSPRDVLKEELVSLQKSAVGFITTAAKLIVPAIDSDSWVAGYDWIISELRIDHGAVASEMQICKALEYLRHKQFGRAIEELKAFEKRDVRLKARAAVNLSFLYFLEGDMNLASDHAHLAVRHDRYNAKALVNLGNALLETKGELDRAKELYLEAIGVEADCVEAIYNLGLVNRQMGALSEALQAFEKLHTLVPSSPEVIHHIAALHEQLGNPKAAAKYFGLLTACAPTDAGTFAYLGHLAAKGEDEASAFNYMNESYQAFPVNLDVISWLGVWYVKGELYEKAVEFFERASEIQPKEVKWRLMVASCYRRMANIRRAIECYEEIHASYPDNVECLRYLCALSKETGRRYEQYETKLAKLGGGGGGGGAGFTAVGGVGNGGGGGATMRQEGGSNAQMTRQDRGGEGGGDRSIGDFNDRGVGGGGGGMKSLGGGEVEQVGAGGGNSAGDDDFGDADLDDLLT
jgi:intraflagellar transport protein 88